MFPMLHALVYRHFREAHNCADFPESNYMQISHLSQLAKRTLAIIFPLLRNDLIRLPDNHIRNYISGDNLFNSMCYIVDMTQHSGFDKNMQPHCTGFVTLISKKIKGIIELCRVVYFSH